jgi:tRNA(fMet)-specific endonuclease VapC
MRILGTDHMTILERGGIGTVALEVRLAQVPVNEIATTIISYEEQMRGWLSYVSQAKTPERLIEAYPSLQNHVEAYRDTTIFTYDALASEEYGRLAQEGIRIGTKDLRIAAICLSYDATLLTRKLRHFQQVPGLRAVDWSQ